MIEDGDFNAETNAQKRQAEKRRRQRQAQRKRRLAQEVQVAFLAYATTGDIETVCLRLNASPAVAYRRIEKARELLASGQMVIRCEFYL